MAHDLTYIPHTFRLHCSHLGTPQRHRLEILVAQAHEPARAADVLRGVDDAQRVEQVDERAPPARQVLGRVRLDDERVVGRGDEAAEQRDVPAAEPGRAVRGVDLRGAGKREYPLEASERIRERENVARAHARGS